jgi:uncharacterized membrane protein
MGKLRTRAGQTNICCATPHRVQNNKCTERLRIQHRRGTVRRGGMLLARNMNQQLKEQETLGDRIADKVASFGGSWAFIIMFFVVVGIYMLMNTGRFGFPAFDCYPYVFLNLLLACIAAIQAPLIMMSQNRELKRDRLRAEQDYEINVRAEQEIQDVQEHLHRIEDHIDWLMQEIKELRNEKR